MPAVPPAASPAPRPRWRAYLAAVAVVAACTGGAALLHEPQDLGNVVAIYLLGVVVTAAAQGRGPAVMAALLGALAVDFLLVPPVFGLLPEHSPHLVTLFVMLAVAVTVGTFAARLREQGEEARERERNTATLYGLARDLGRAADAGAVARAACDHVQRRFGCRAVLLAALPDGALQSLDGSTAEPHLLAAAAAALTQPERAAGPFWPLSAGARPLGVLALLPAPGAEPVPQPPQPYLETIANQTAVALERTRLADAARQAALAVEQERLRNTLLSSVSHDLRTPIATIVGASSVLLREPALDARTRTELLESIHQEGGRLEQQVRNLLTMTRLEAHAVEVHADWTPVEEVVGAALTRLEEALRGREVITRLAADLPPVPMDGLLVEQLLTNLLENALRHTPPGTPIEITVHSGPDAVQLTVADRGPGLAADDPEDLFDKFRRGPESRGFGLGLPICRAIAALHGGTIRAEQRPGGGALFTVTLPLTRPASLPPLPPLLPRTAS